MNTLKLVPLICLFLSSIANAQYIPEPLKPWADWVREKDDAHGCAKLNDAKVCDWPSRLALDVNQKGASFEYQVKADKFLELELPGGDKVQPTDIAVSSGGKATFAPPYRSDRSPWITLNPGLYSIRGNFSWDAPPESLHVPKNIGLVELAINGKRIQSPRVTSEGVLWLQENMEVGGAAAPADSIRLFVYRVLEDGSPLRVRSNFRLTIAGKSREITLPGILPLGITPVELRSDLPVRFGAGNTLIIQARPGTYSISITSAGLPTTASLSPPSVSLPGWPEHEVWVWIPNDSQRAVTVEGGTRVDSSMTELPAEEQGKATYLITSDESLKFETIRRGEEEPAQNSLNLTRTMWLDLNGKGFSVQDNISGNLYRDWRLSALPGFELGRVSEGGDAMLITSLEEGGPPGVELRGRSPSIIADARLSDSSSPFSATGWNHAFNSLAVTLNLPPGWTLFEAYGVDRSSSSWFGSWTLLDIWLLIFLVIAVARLFGNQVAGLAVVALILGHHTPGALRQCWFHLVASGILLRYLPDNQLRRFARFYLGITAFAVVVLAVALAIFEVRDGLFPSVGRMGLGQASLLSPIYYLLEGTVLGWTIFMISLWSLVMIFQLKIIRGIALLIFGVTALIVYAGFSDSYFYSPGDSMTNYQTLSAASEGILEQRFYAEGDVPAPQAKSFSYGRSMKSLNQIDPNAVVQTGKGIPNWQFRSYSLGFQGQVTPDQKVNLVLLSPFVNGILNLLRALAFLLLTWVFVKFARTEWSKGVITALVLGVLVFGNGMTAHAQNYPSQELLNDLAARLKARECGENCSNFGKATLNVSGAKVVLQVAATSDGDSGVPLPGPMNQIDWREVLVEGGAASALRRDAQGFTWIRLGNGQHEIRAVGNLLSKDAVTLQWPLEPSHLTVNSEGYEVDGVDGFGSIQGSIQLVPVAGTVKDTIEQGESVDLPSWFIVQRRLNLGLPWQVTTEVTRLGSNDRPARVKVPLLKGESVTQQGLTVESGAAQVVFGRGVGSVAWTSDLAQSNELSLQAPQGNGVSETWQLWCSTMWRCAPQGISPTASTIGNEQGWIWEPYSDEKIVISVTRPLGIAGRSVTLDSTGYRITPGLRSTEATIQIKVRSSQGSSLAVKLPDNSTLAKVENDGKEETSRYSGQRLSLPLKPGANSFNVKFQFPTDMGIFWRVPSLEFGEASSNLNTEVVTPSHRWILAVGGGGWGPTVLFWSKLVVVVMMAVLLGMSRLTPLTIGNWIIFGLGLATLPYELMLVVPIWFMALQFRRTHPFPGAFKFNLFQIALIFLTIATIAVIYRAIEVGLILQPNMAIAGNNSSDSLLRWYFDFVGTILPSPWIVSVPMWTWRLVMLFWSIWLVFGLMKWLWWAFESMNDGGIWKGREPKPAQQTGK